MAEGVLLMILPSVRVMTPPVAIVMVPVLSNVPENKFKFMIVKLELVAKVVAARFTVSVFNA